MRAGQVCGTCTGCSPFYSGGFPGVCANVPTRAECLDKNGVWSGYAGSLSNGGERLTLSALFRDNVTTVDSVYYDDDGEWPTRPDGAPLRSPPNLRRPMGMSAYLPGASLERASLSMGASSDDATIWRGSIVAGGTPCLPYMLLGEELRVRISDWETDPQHPSPEDAVVVRVHLTGTDLASSPPHTVTLMWENTICEIGASAVVMSELPGRRVLGAAYRSASGRRLRSEDTLVYGATLPPMPAEALIRMTVDVFTGYAECTSARLPHVSETTPFMSFWVHERGSVPTVLPHIVLYGENFGSQLHQPPPELLTAADRVDWRRYSSTPPTEAFWPNVSAVVVLPPGPDALPHVYDGAVVAPSESGHAVYFDHKNKFEGLQRITLVETVPTRVMGGVASPLAQHMSLNFMSGPPFRAVGAPSARWYRSTLFIPHRGRVDAQRLLVHDLDQTWLEQNGFAGADLFRTEARNPEQWENPASWSLGGQSVSALFAQHTNLGDASAPDQLESILLQIAAGDDVVGLQGKSFTQFAAATTLLSNWDGLQHNNWLVRENSTGTWRVMPAFAARTFGIMDAMDTLTDHQMIDLPLDYPLDGDGLCCQYGSRATHPLVAHLLSNDAEHRDFLNAIKCSMAFTFGTGLTEKLDVVEEVLLHDLNLLTDWACQNDDCDDVQTHWWNATNGTIFVEPPDQRLEQLVSAFSYIRTYISERHGRLQSLSAIEATECAYESKYWSDESYWLTRGLPGTPAEGDTVFIPGGESVVLDVDTPVLDRVVIQGHLQVSRSAEHIQLHANYIFVLNGGVLQAGSQITPLQSAFTINLHGTKSSPLVQRWGSKVLAVMKGGRLDLHGQTRSPSWTRLETPVDAGEREMTLQAGAAMDWPAGEEIAIGTTSHDVAETEIRLVESTTRTGVMTLVDAVSHSHVGATYSFAGSEVEVADGTTERREFDGRSVLASLTRSIKIVGPEDADGWGCTLVVQGHAYIDNTEMRYCGKRGSGTFAALIDGRGPGIMSGYMRNSLFRDSYGDVIATRGDTGDVLPFQFSGNVVFQATGTAYSLQAPVSLFSTNAALSIFQAGDSGGVGFDAHAITMDSNVAIGAQRYGFQVSAAACSGAPELPPNIAQASGVSGVHIVTSDPGRARCGRITGFQAIKNIGAGFSSMVTGSLTITNVVAIDNHVGFQLAGHFSPGMAPSVLIIDGSTIVARVGQDNSDGDCLPGESRRPTASIGVVPASFVELRRCTEEPPTFAQGGCDPESEGPVLMAAPDAGFMEVRSVSFLNFRSADDTCGPSYAFTHTASEQTVVFTKVKGITAMIGAEYVPVPWFLPATTENSDGPNHVVVEDRDGTFAGEANAWLVSRNVGMALDCSLLASQKALRCGADQEFRRLLIEPVRDNNGAGSQYLGTTWNAVSVENVADENPCNANAMTIGSVRPGCDILYRGDGDGRFWTAFDVKTPRRIRFKMQPLVGSLRLRVLPGIPPRDANLPPAILTIAFPVDPVHTYYVWKDGVRLMPEPAGYTVGVQDATGTYTRADHSITLALHVSNVIELRAERTLVLDVMVRDLNTSSDIAGAFVPLFGVDEMNAVVGSVESEEVSVLSTRETVRVDVVSESLMALHPGSFAVDCGDRFTLADAANALAFEEVDPLDFGTTEEDWYLRNLFRQATAFVRGCNDPNAYDYRVGDVDHDPNACNYASMRCRKRTPALSYHLDR